MDPEQQQAFREAVDRKNAEAEAQSRAQGAGGQTAPGDPVTDTDSQGPIHETGRPQDVFSIRDKNAGKGKKTADKWNQ